MINNITDTKTNYLSIYSKLFEMLKWNIDIIIKNYDTEISKIHIDLSEIPNMFYTIKQYVDDYNKVNKKKLDYEKLDYYISRRK